MARRWVRIGSIAAALVLAIFLLASMNSLRSTATRSTPFGGDGLEVQQDQEPPESTPQPAQPEEKLPEKLLSTPTIEVPDAPQDEPKPLDTDIHPDLEPPDTEEHPNPEPEHELQTSTSTEPAAEPSPTPLSKTIVMGRLESQDTDWVAQALPEWQNAIYLVDLPANATSPTGLRTKINKSKEAMPYLTYIIDNYPHFPDVMVFIHAHRKGYPEAWHNDAKDHDAVNMLHDLRLDVVVERGYVNLRCIELPGCPDEIRPWRNPPDAERVPEQIFPYVYAEFFNLPLSEVRRQVEVVATPCCAQFAVSRDQMLKKPKEEYERYRTYLEQTTYDDDTIGRVLEYMWHIIFGRDAVHCEKTSKCWCEVFGRCSKNRPHPGGRGWGGRGPD